MKYNCDLNMAEENSLSKIINMIRPHSTVLEFGPANGRMTKYLKEHLGCSVYIVEIDKEAFQDAIQYAQQGICGDIEKFEWVEKFKNVSFDYISYADVLEHLRFPEKVFRKSVEMLKEDGSIVFSLPNIAFSDILLKLYLNRFDYTPTGLLDDSHVHFFALENIKELVYSCGMDFAQLDAVYHFTGETEQKFDIDKIPQDVYQVISGKQCGTVYQFVGKVQRRSQIQKTSPTTKDQLLGNWRVESKKAQVYCDFGEGFIAQQMDSPTIYQNLEQVFTLTFTIPEGVKAVRFDPIEDIAKIQLVSCSMNGVKIKIYPSNANFSLDGYDVFFHTDPIYLLEEEEWPSGSEIHFVWKCDVLGKKEYIAFIDQLMQQQQVNQDAVDHSEIIADLKAEYTQLYEGKEKIVQGYEQALLERDDAYRTLQNEYASVYTAKDEMAQAYESAFHEKDSLYQKLQGEYEKLYAAKDEMAQAYESAFREKDSLYQTLQGEYEKLYTAKDEMVQAYDRALQEKEAMIGSKDKELAEISAAFDILSANFDKKVQEFNEQRKTLEKIYHAKFWKIFQKVNHL